jgi:hypothetical protein
MFQSAYELHRQTLIAYLRMKVDQEDWHGVRDCAVDIEILDAKNQGAVDPNAKDMHRLP